MTSDSAWRPHPNLIRARDFDERQFERQADPADSTEWTQEPWTGDPDKWIAVRRVRTPVEFRANNKEVVMIDEWGYESWLASCCSAERAARYAEAEAAALQRDQIREPRPEGLSRHLRLGR